MDSRISFQRLLGTLVYVCMNKSHNTKGFREQKNYKKMEYVISHNAPQILKQCITTKFATILSWLQSSCSSQVREICVAKRHIPIMHCVKRDQPSFAKSYKYPSAMHSYQNCSIGASNKRFRPFQCLALNKHKLHICEYCKQIYIYSPSITYSQYHSYFVFISNLQLLGD